MSLKFFWTFPLLLLYFGGQATLSRSPKKELRIQEENKNFISKVNLNEFWPFPDTMSKVDPYLFELEIQLTSEQNDHKPF